MSRSFRDLLKFSAPALLSAALLSGCGDGSSGSADLGQGPSVESPPPPVTVTETFDFSAPNGVFVVGTPPVHARFSGGVAENNGAWIVKSGTTAVIDFATPADTVEFSTQDSYTPTAAAQNALAGEPPVAQAITNKFSVPMFFRGIGADWTAVPARRFRPHTCDDNVLVLRMDLGPDIVEDTFKIADFDWTDATNCGKNDTSDLVTVNTPYSMVCRGGLGLDAKFTIPEQATWKFTFDVRNEESPVLTIAKDSPDDCGGGGGGEVVPDSTEIRIYGIDTLNPAAEVQLLTTLTDEASGAISVAEIADRTGGSPRITRIEIENLGTRGDIGIEDFEWVADARFAPEVIETDIVYRRPLAGQTDGTRIRIGDTTHDCLADPNSAFSCIVRDVLVYPFANDYLVVTNADGSTETIQFNAGQGGDVDDDDPGEVVFAISGVGIARNGLPGSEAGVALPTNAKEVILFYKRDDNDYEGWGLHLFPIDPSGDSWTVYSSPKVSEGIDPQWGAYLPHRPAGRGGSALQQQSGRHRHVPGGARRRDPPG